MTAAKYPTLRLGVLLAVTTGLRRGDIETIRIGDVHFDRSTISTQNRKAGKSMPERPIPEAIMTELANHVAGLADGQERLFADRFSQKRWDRVREKVKVLYARRLMTMRLRIETAETIVRTAEDTSTCDICFHHVRPPEMLPSVYKDRLSGRCE